MTNASYPSVPHVVVIDPAMKIAETECFNLLVHRSPLPCTYHLPAMFGMQSLAAEDMSQARAIILLGSAASVNERVEWQTKLEGWLRPHLERKIPTMGFCYGHQMLAHMFGGKVDYVFPDQSKHVGLREVAMEATPWGKISRGKLVVSHCETVVEAPRSMRVFATSPEIGTDGLAHADLPIWSFQSHPEATIEFLASHGISTDDGAAKLAYGHGIVEDFLNFAAKSGR